MRKIFAIAFSAIIATACVTTSPAPSEKPVSNAEKFYIADARKTGFLIYQGGQLNNAAWDGEYLVYRLKSSSFTIKTSYKSMRIYISEKDAGEFRSTGKTNPHVLSSALSGAASRDADYLFVADYTDPLDSNNALNPAHGLKALSERENVYEVNNLFFLKTRKEIALSKFAGTLFAYAWVDFNGDEKIGLDEVSRIKFILPGLN